MSEDKTPVSSAEEEGPFSLRKVGEFFLRVWDLQRDTKDLKEQCARLQAQVDAQQRIIDEHNGQLKVILTTLDRGIENRIQSVAEETVIRALLETTRQDDGEI